MSRSEGELRWSRSSLFDIIGDAEIPQHARDALASEDGMLKWNYWNSSAPHYHLSCHVRYIVKIKSLFSTFAHNRMTNSPLALPRTRTMTSVRGLSIVRNFSPNWRTLGCRCSTSFRPRILALTATAVRVVSERNEVEVWIAKNGTHKKYSLCLSAELNSSEFSHK